MTTEQFEQVKRMLSVYQYTITQDNEKVWFNMLNRFQWEDIKEGVIEYCQTETDRPTYNHIIRSIENVINARKKMRYFDIHNNRTVKCPRCKDFGYTLKVYPNGSDAMTPCDYVTGREKYPWFFMSEEEQTEWITEQNKRGQNVPMKVFKADDEFKKAYYYGADDKGGTEWHGEHYEKVRSKVAGTEND